MLFITIQRKQQFFGVITRRYGASPLCCGYLWPALQNRHENSRDAVLPSTTTETADLRQLSMVSCYTNDAWLFYIQKYNSINQSMNIIIFIHIVKILKLYTITSNNDINLFVIKI